MVPIGTMNDCVSFNMLFLFIYMMALPKREEICLIFCFLSV